MVFLLSPLQCKRHRLREFEETNLKTKLKRSLRIASRKILRPLSGFRPRIRPLYDDIVCVKTAYTRQKKQAEPEFLNFYGAQDLISKNQFRQAL
jgi:hypothetical protein